MTTFTEPARIGDVLKREWDALYNREIGTVASGQNLLLGTVLGRVTVGGELVELDPAAADGSETAIGVLLEPVDASTAALSGVFLARGPAVVHDGALVFDAGVTAPQRAAAIAQLRALGIVSRTGIGGAPVAVS